MRGINTCSVAVVVIAAIVLVSAIDNAVEEEKEYTDDNCEGAVDADIRLPSRCCCNCTRLEEQLPLCRTAAAAAPADGTLTNPWTRRTVTTTPIVNIINTFDFEEEKEQQESESIVSGCLSNVLYYSIFLYLYRYINLTEYFIMVLFLVWCFFGIIG